jgi:hypothetical protein
MALACPPTVARGQTDEWRPDLIAKYESSGGQNIPNWKFDGPQGRHSAGGVCQMLTHTWERVAPTIDIDIVKFPVAGAASEFDQWRACWKLWTLDGYDPWTCCNSQLRAVLQHGETISAATVRRSSTAAVVVRGRKLADPNDDKVSVAAARLTANSDVYHLSR